jgi:HSP20 family protein
MAEKHNRQGQGQRGLQRSPEQSRDVLSRRDPFGPLWYGPFSMMRRMQEDMDRMFGGFGRGRGWMAPWTDVEGADWTPAIEAFQRGDEFVIRADVPGLSRDDLSVEIGDDAVTVRGERKYDHKEEREGVYRSERAYGSFYRVVPLPEGAVTESAKANFKEGVLEIVVKAPPHEVRRGRRLEIGRELSQKADSKK